MVRMAQGCGWLRGVASRRWKASGRLGDAEMQGVRAQPLREEWTSRWSRCPLRPVGTILRGWRPYGVPTELRSGGPSPPHSPLYLLGCAIPGMVARVGPAGNHGDTEARRSDGEDHEPRGGVGRLRCGERGFRGGAGAEKWEWITSTNADSSGGEPDLRD